VLNKGVNKVKILPANITADYYFIANNQQVAINKEVEK